MHYTNNLLRNENQAREEIRQEVARALGIEPDKLPALLNTEQTALILGVQATTLQNWRSLGRHRLPYVKVGRLPRYRIGDLVDWIAERTRNPEV